MKDLTDFDHAGLHARLVAEITAWDHWRAQQSRAAFLGILEIHRPNTVNHIEPCERHRYKPGMSAADFSPLWPETCDDCTSSPFVECSVTDDSYRGTPCLELRIIAEALGIVASR